MEYNDKQLAIINTAEKLFSVTGFDGTSVRDIANEAGVNVAMISYYFGSKEKLMEAVFEQKTNKIRLRVENLMQDSKLSHMEKVYVLIDDYMDKFFSQQEFHKIMMREQLSEKNSLVMDLIHELKKRNHESIKSLINDGQKKGAFKKNIDLVFMMATLTGVASQIVTTQRFYQEVNNIHDVAHEEFSKQLKKKLSTYLKNIFKAILSNEE